MTRAEELLSIGAFASLTRLSLKVLQLYDQLNLLQPRWVDRNLAIVIMARIRSSSWQAGKPPV